MPAANPFAYVEIPVGDLARAKAFYEAVFDLSLELTEVDGHPMALFPFADGRPGASGALAQGDSYVPGPSGPRVYLAVDSVERTLARALAAGARPHYPVTEVPGYGWVAEFIDTEGNCIALHAPPAPADPPASPAQARGGTTLRLLGPGDGPILRGLSAMLGEAFEDPQTYTARPPTDAYLAGLLGQPTFIAIVALQGDRVVGGLVAYELPKFEQARSEIYLYDLGVAEDQRRQGVATALIRRLQAVAAERGAWVVYVQADHGDDPAIALYTRLGTREDVLHFDLEPSGDRE